MIRYLVLCVMAWATIAVAQAENTEQSCPPAFVGIRMIQRDGDILIEAVAKVEALSEESDSLKLTEAEARLEAKAQLKMYMEHIGIPVQGGGIVSKVTCRHGLDVYASSMFDSKNRARANKLKDDLQRSRKNGNTE